VADWTTILTTFGAAGIAAAGGWYGARKTAEVSLKQADAENERLREQHREDHLRNRLGTYHDFVAADRELARMVMEEVPGLDVAEAMNLYRRNIQHERSNVVGRLVSLEHAASGLWATFTSDELLLLRDAATPGTSQPKWPGEARRPTPSTSSSAPSRSSAAPPPTASGRR
jgi:hypothetical protein